LDIAYSKNGVPIRLTQERWLHITTGHPEVADFYHEILETVEIPEVIYEGNQNAQIAVKPLERMEAKYLAVTYKEENDDGFIITAYITSKLKGLQAKPVLWKAPK
jgi:hypothetical protein